MTRPASTLLAAGLRPTEPAPAERAESAAPLAWEARPERVSVQTADGSEMRDLHAVYIEGERWGYVDGADAERIARELANDPAPSTFGTAPDASIPSAVDALTREQTRHAITRDAHRSLVSALREQILTWQRASIEYASRAEWARDPAAASMRAHAARLAACARELEALLAGHTGTLPDDDAEVLADSPAPGREVVR